jgi:hypothetical protein
MSIDTTLPTERIRPTDRGIAYAQAYKAPCLDYRNVVFRGKLLFRFDPVRGIIELQERGEKILIDLSVVAAGG